LDEGRASVKTSGKKKTNSTDLTLLGGGKNSNAKAKRRPGGYATGVQAKKKEASLMRKGVHGRS